jgi:RimJ/RimL family protein N-acetyltransferase
MIVRPWQEGDTQKLALQPSQQYLSGILDDLNIKVLADKGLVQVGEVDGEVIAIAGIAPQWENRAIAWALISDEAGPHFIQIHKAVKRFFNRNPIRRLEATVDVGFEQGHRWMEMLGFEIEGYMVAYRPDGKDQILYARVRR